MNQRIIKEKAGAYVRAHAERVQYNLDVELTGSSNVSGENAVARRAIYMGLDRDSFMDGHDPAGGRASALARSWATAREKIGIKPTVPWVPTHGVCRIGESYVSEVTGQLFNPLTSNRPKGVTYDSFSEAIFESTDPGTAHKIASEMAGTSDADRVLELLNSGKRSKTRTANREKANEIIDEFFKSNVPWAKHGLASHELSSYDSWMNEVDDIDDKRTGRTFVDASRRKGERTSWQEIGHTLMSDREIEFYSQMFKARPGYDMAWANCQHHVQEFRGLLESGIMPDWMRHVDGTVLPEYQKMTETEQDRDWETFANRTQSLYHS